MNTRTTVYFEPKLHQALKIHSAQCQKTLSQMLNDLVIAHFKEDWEDLQTLEARKHEPTVTYEELLNQLKEDGTL